MVANDPRRLAVLVLNAVAAGDLDAVRRVLADADAEMAERVVWWLSGWLLGDYDLDLKIRDDAPGAARSALVRLSAALAYDPMNGDDQMARRRKSTSEFDGYAVPVGEVALAARLGPAQIEDALERAGVPTFVDWRGHLVVKPADARRFVTETRERNDRHAAEQAEHRKRQQLAEAEARRQAGDPKRFEAAVREAQRQAGVR